MKYVSLDSLEFVEVSHNPKVKKQVMLVNGDLGPVTIFSRGVFPPGEVVGKHHHKDMGEVFFCHSGEGIINLNGKDYELVPGRCMAVEPFEDHEITNTGTEDLVLIYFGVKM